MFVTRADRLKKLLTAEGSWLTASRIGEQAARAAWLIA